MPRRIQTYSDGLGWNFYNLLSTAGTFVMAVGFALFIYSFVAMFRRGQVAGNDPWDGRTLEWATSSPPPYYNFPSTPVVTGIDAHWEAKYPGTMHDHDEEPYPFKEDPKHGIHMPGQSWYPFIMALALTVGGFATIYHNWAVGIAMLVVTAICTYAWAFEGVGGGHVYPEGAKSSDRAATDEEGRP